MHPLITIAASAMLLVFVPACQGTAKEAAFDQSSDRQPRSVSGTYMLAGQMETASGLRIKDDGRFDWYLIVGALDLFANGSWSRNGNNIMLRFEETSSNAPGDREFPLETMTLRIEGERLVPEDGFTGVYLPVTPSNGAAEKD